MKAFPRKGSIAYGMQQNNLKKRKRTLRIWKLINKFWMIPLYKIGLLPLIGFKNSFLILSTIGNKTGKKRTVGLSIRKIEEQIYVFAARRKNTHWLKNHFANPSLTKIKYGFKSVFQFY